MALPLFVYGTLKRAGPRGPHALLRQARYLNAASISGSLYDLGPYPGVYRGSARRRRVFGELYQLPDQGENRALRALDKYEGREFVRRRVFVTLRDGRRRAAWIYLLRKLPRKTARPVASGRWPKRNRAA